MRMTCCLVLLNACLLHPATAQDEPPQLFGTPLQFGNSAGDDVQPTLTATLKPLTERTAELRVTLVLPPDFYTYSMNPSFGGHTSIRLTAHDSLTPVSSQWTPDRPPKSEMDPYLEQRVEKFFDQVTWSQVLRSSTPLSGDLQVRGELTGQYCGSGEFGVCKPIDPPMTFVARMDAKAPASAADGTEGVAVGSADTADAATVTITPDIRHDDPDPTQPITFDVSLSPPRAAVGDEVTLSIRSTLGPAWHTYALDQDPSGGGGTPTEILLFEHPGLEPIDASFHPTAPPVVTDEFGIVQRVHYEAVTWTRRFTVSAAEASVEGSVIYQLCTERNCLTPAEAEFSVALAVSGSRDAGTRPLAAMPSSRTTNDGSEPASPAADVRVTDNGPAGSAAGPATADDGVAEFSNSDPRSGGLLVFMLSAFGAGALALLTPCVFPMIPVTVAFFLKQSEKKHGNAVVLAFVYSAAIVIAFTFLGVFVAAVFGSQALTQAANNPWLNLFFAALFLGFGLSLMGLFEIRVPNFLLTWSSKQESTGGLVGVMFMALTFTLVSFTCTFAFLGPILVWAANGELLWPIIGMVSFSTAFAAPFLILALFPSLLSALPKSGGWLNSVKVTMAFVEFALVLKFLSVADIALSATGMPYWIDSQGFLACWIVIAATTGLYLLGVFRMDHDTPVDGISPIRCLAAIGFLCLAGYLSVGTFAAEKPRGWLWEQVVAFAPPEFTVEQGEDDTLTVVHGDLTWFLDMERAVAESTASQKPLFIDFTGVNCVNCRKMEKTVLNKEAVIEVLDDCVRAQLFVDIVPIPDKSQAQTLLEANKRLQRDWFGDVTMPAYAVVSPDGETVLARYKNLDSSGGVEFRRFLDAGLQRWNELQSRHDGGVAPATVSFASQRTAQD